MTNRRVSGVKFTAGFIRERQEEQAMRLRTTIISAVLAKTGVALPMTMTLDQLARAAAKHGVRLVIVGVEI